MELRSHTSPVGLGAWLGFLNTLVIAIGMSAKDAHDRSGTILVVTAVACLPAVLTGATLGSIAQQLARSPVWLRRLLLIPPALGLVGALALTFQLTGFVPVACIPTLACILYLERRTRAEARLPIVVAR